LNNRPPAIWAKKFQIYTMIHGTAAQDNPVSFLLEKGTHIPFEILGA
jgi:hypothetical protein